IVEGLKHLQDIRMLMGTDLSILPKDADLLRGDLHGDFPPGSRTLDGGGGLKPGNIADDDRIEGQPFQRMALSYQSEPVASNESAAMWGREGKQIREVVESYPAVTVFRVLGGGPLAVRKVNAHFAIRRVLARLVANFGPEAITLHLRVREQLQQTDILMLVQK